MGISQKDSAERMRDEMNAFSAGLPAFDEPGIDGHWRKYLDRPCLRWVVNVRS